MSRATSGNTIRRSRMGAVAAVLASLAVALTAGVGARAQSDDRISVDGQILEVAAGGKSFRLKTKAGVETIQVDDETLIKGKLQKNLAVTVIYEKASRLAVVIVPAKKAASAAVKKATPAAIASERPAVDPKAAEAAWSAARGKLMDVVVTGSGKTLDDAKQNAYQAAVEQTFGVLVDAATLVENDKLIEDFALTYAEGDVHDWELLEETTKGGLHTVRIRASVSVEKLAERLRAKNIAMRDVPEELFFRTAVESISTQKDALAALTQVMKRFGPEKMIRPLIVDRPTVVSQDDDFATLKVNVQTAGDRADWKEFRTELLALITSDPKTKASRLVGDCQSNEYHDSTFYALDFNDEVLQTMYEMQGKGTEYGYWLIVLLDLAAPSEPHRMDSRWEAYWVNKAVTPILDALEDREFLVRVAVMDADNRVLAETDRKLTMWNQSVKGLYISRDGGWKRDCYYLAPFFWGDGRYYVPRWSLEPFLVDIPLFDLKNATRVVATIEQAPAARKE